MPGALPIRGRLYELGMFVAVLAIALWWKGVLGVEWTIVGVVLGASIVVADVTLHRRGEEE